MLARGAKFFYGASLVTLPWAGWGVLKLATGRDWGGGLQPSWVFLALAILCFGLERMGDGWSFLRRQTSVPHVQVRWWLWGTVAVFAAVLLSWTGLRWAPSGESEAVTQGRFVKQFIQLGIMVCFAVWPALWTRGPDRWMWSVKLLLIGGVIQVGYGLLQGIHYYIPLPGFGVLEGVCTSNPSILSGSGELYLGDSFRHVPRLRGMNCEPLYLGNYLLFLLPLTLLRVWSIQTRRWIAGGLLFLLLGTWSRGAWFGLAGQLVLAGAMILSLGKDRRQGFWSLDHRAWKLTLGSLLVLLVAAPLVGYFTGWEALLFPYRRLVQTFSGQDWSNLTRLYSMQAGWRAFLLNPATGIGWGQFGWHFPLLVDPMGLQSQFTWPVVNSFPLLVLCETGLVGILVFGGWILGLVRGVGARWNFLRLGPARREVAAIQGHILFCAALAVAGVWFQMLTFSQYNLPHIWVSIGLLLAILADFDLSSEDGSGDAKGWSGQ